MATMREEIDKYKAQVNAYDAGRPNTAAAPKADGQFKPAESAGMRMPEPVRQPVATNPARPVQPFVDTEGQVMAANQRAAFGDVSRLPQEMKTPSAIVTHIDNKKAEAASLAANPARRLGMTGDRGLLVAAADTLNRGSNRAPLPLSVTTKDIEKPSAGQANPSANQPVSGSTPAKVDPSPNAWAGNYAAADASGQGIFTDPETGRTSIRLTGDAGNKFMQDQDKAIAEGKGVPTTADEMAARRKAMGGYGGMFKQPAAEVPATARPGMTLQATPVVSKRNAVPTTTGDPLTDQRNAEAALANRQAEVTQAERNTPGLLYGPGSRDFIDPRLSEPEQRTRQSEIATQRIEDMRQARDATIAQTQARDAGLAYSGLPTDEARNRAMEPYAERRATINQRNANMAMAGEQEVARLAAADKVAEREAKEAQDVRKDATDRYVADKNAELATSNAQISAESKRLDREATMKAALLKLEQTKDPILLEKLKGYNSWLETMMNMPGSEITPEQLAYGQEKYGVKELFTVDPMAKIVIPAPKG